MKLKYKKHSYRNPYLKKGIAQIKMISEKFLHNDVELVLEVETSTFADYYHISYSGFDKKEFERTDGIHGRFHGYHFGSFDTFEDVQKFIMETYGFRLVKNGETVKHWYGL